MEDGFSSFGGPVTSTDWCNKNYVHSSYVAEFFNTLSNVPCILLALFGFVNAVSLHLSNMTLAIGSMLYHATLQRVINIFKYYAYPGGDRLNTAEKKKRALKQKRQRV